MTALKPAAVEAFCRAPDPAVKIALVHGADEGRVREIATNLVKAVAGSLDDPFRVSRLSEDRLAADPALLSDEALAMSMTGGRRAVWVSQCGSGFQRAAEIYLETPGGDSLVVGEAGALPKTSKLRQLLEKSPKATVIACYEDTPEDLRRIAVEAARREGLAFNDDALALLVDLIGADRAASRGEIEKLLLYCHGTGRIGAEDVLAICADASAASLDELIDAVLDGDAAGAMGSLDGLTGAGLPPTVVLGSVHSHVLRLLGFRLDIDGGRDRESVLRSARPPIFFQRLSRVGRQVGLWDRESLFSAARTVSLAVDQTRQFPALETALAERALLALARKSQSLRTRAG